MIQFEQMYPAGKPVWVAPDAVIVVEPHTVTQIQGVGRVKEVVGTRLVLTNGGRVDVLGPPLDVLQRLDRDRD